jgi:hypothetical protein
MRQLALLAAVFAFSNCLEIEPVDQGVTPYLIAHDGIDSIYYTPFRRFRVNSEDEPSTGVGKTNKLISNLTYAPSALEYCFKMQILYTCA